MTGLASLPRLERAPAATAAEMAEADRVASEELGIPLAVLMENAARQVAAATRALLGGAAGRTVVALAGTGNNGGDALAALRHLQGWGARVGALVAGRREALRPLAALQHDLLERLGVAVRDSGAMPDADVAAALRDADAIVDGLLGYSARGAARGEIARLVALANASGRRIVAVDLPSGLDPDTGAATGPAVRAALTVTLALPKPGLLAPGARPYVGELLLADIGIPAPAYGARAGEVGGLFRSGDLVRLDLR